MFWSVKELSEVTGLPVYCISWSLRKLSYVDRNLTCSPYDFLELFRNAEYVVTNSFHGTAFSILFQKVFWVYETSIANHRLTSIIDNLGLRTRLLSRGQKLEMGDAIDYSKVNKQLNSFVQESIKYLNDIIK